MLQNKQIVNVTKKKKLSGTLVYLTSHWQLYIMLALPLIYIIVFAYVPMAGLQMAFRDFRPSLGLYDSEFVGLKHFIRFFNSPSFIVILRNTFL